MSFHLQTHRYDEAITVECHGKLTFEHAPQLRNKIRTLIPDEKRIILDLKEVPFMDSSGLGALVTLYVSGRSRNCKIELINVSPALRSLLGMTNLLSLFEQAGRYGASSRDLQAKRIRYSTPLSSPNTSPQFPNTNRLLANRHLLRQATRRFPRSTSCVN